MSCKKVINFAVQFLGDGSNCVIVTIADDPVFVGPAPISGVVLDTGFSVASALPASISGVSVPGLTLSGAPTYALGILTVTFTGNTVTGTLYTMQGTLNYN